jgi:hypothetical protein
MGMNYRFIFVLGSLLFCGIGGHTQKVQSLKDIKKMMENAREINSLPCLLVMTNYDTTWGKSLEWKWNKKTNGGEWNIDGTIIREDSVMFYQDNEGFHKISYIKIGKARIADDQARIIKGKIDVFVSNWKSRGTGPTFDPSSGYVPGTDSHTGSQYFIRKKTIPILVTYGNLKEYVSDNKAASAQYVIEFGAGKKPEDSINDWGAIDRVIEIYNKQ